MNKEKDPFGNWDIRKEPNLRDRHNADLDEKVESKSESTKNLFEREDSTEDKSDEEVDTPPFFRRRRK